MMARLMRRRGRAPIRLNPIPAAIAALQDQLLSADAGAPRRVHDYSRRQWGHDYILEPHHSDPSTADVAGWGTGLRVGDYLLLNHSDRRGRALYRIETLDYKVDPPDMWSGTALFIPGSSPEGQRIGVLIQGLPSGGWLEV